MNTSLRILLVEDDDTEAVALTAALEALSDRYPLVVTRVRTLLEAAELAAEQHVIITGSAVRDATSVSEVQSLVERTHCPIFVYSADASLDSMVAAGFAGASGYVTAGTPFEHVMPMIVCEHARTVKLLEMARHRELTRQRLIQRLGVSE